MTEKLKKLKNWKEKKAKEQNYFHEIRGKMDQQQNGRRQKGPQQNGLRQSGRAKKMCFCYYSDSKGLSLDSLAV